MHRHYLSDNLPLDQIKAHQFFHQGKLLSAAQIATRLEKTPIPTWAYLLIAHYITTLDKNKHCSRQLTPFETLCTKTTPQYHLISCIPNLIFNNLKANESLACKKWEAELSISLTAENWEQIFLNIHKGSTNVTTQENGYKIQSRWYHTTVLSHIFKPEIPETCWRCHQERGTLLHIWWSCSPLQNFWSEVSHITAQVTSYNLDFTPAQFLLHHSPIPHTSYHKSLTMHMIKQCIPIHWNSKQIPTLTEMEKLIHISRDTLTKCSHKWPVGYTTRHHVNTPTS